MEMKKLKSKKNIKSKNIKTQKGGRTTIDGPIIKYNKGNAQSTRLNCINCGHTSFILKTLTLGTKIKAFLDYDILDNRFKEFTCISCGFVQIYSNNITCNGRTCD